MPYALRVFELLRKAHKYGVMLSLTDIEQVDFTLILQIENILYSLENLQNSPEYNKPSSSLELQKMMNK